MNLRDYQSEAGAAIDIALRKTDGNPCVVIPTGGGKTVIIADRIKEYLTLWPATRICVVAHVKELVSQNADKLRAYWPEGRDQVGVFSAGLRSRDVFHPVIFASIQSVHDKALQLGRFDLIFVDEAHRIPLSEDGTYRRFIEDCRAINPQLRVVGFTATPYRMSKGMVCGPNYILNHVCYEVGVYDLIQRGFLSPIITPRQALENVADASALHIRNGEYIASEVEDLVDRGDVVTSAVRQVVELGAGRRAWILFAASIAHAEHVSEELKVHGIMAPVVHSKIPRAERDQRIEDFVRGRTRAIVNVNVLSEGFDAPHIDLVAMLRPTKSPGLYYQQVGRGLRLSPAKEDCLVLDFAGNIAEHGPIDKIKVKAASGDGAAPIKQCPQCQAMLPIGQMVCQDCGYIFEPVEGLPKPPHAPRASDDAILSVHLQRPEKMGVLKAYYFKHTPRDGRAPTLRVEYLCQGLKSIKEWHAFEPDAKPFARGKAEVWWNNVARPQYHGEPLAPPDSVDMAVSMLNHQDVTARVPTQIEVDKRDKYPRIVAYRFDDPAAEGGEDPGPGARPGGYAGHADGNTVQQV